MRTPIRVCAVALLLALAAPRAAWPEDAAAEYHGRSAADWATDLAAPALDARRQAAFALWELGPEARPHVRALAAALRDEDDYVRSTVEKVLARFDWQRAVSTLEKALPELIDALGDERPTVRVAAANLIWSAGPIPNVKGQAPPPAGLVPALAVALRDTDAAVRANAAAALANLGATGADALPNLKAARQDEDAKVRMWVVRALSWIDAERATAWVLELAGDADEGVRTAVLEAAGNAPPGVADIAGEALRKGLADASPAVRTAAVNGLGSLGGAKAAADLVGVLEGDADPALRTLAARQLGWIGDLSALPHLEAALQSEDEVLLGGAVCGLCSLGPEGAEALPRMIELLRHGSPSLKQGIAGCLGSLGPLAEPALPALVEALGAADAGVRAMAASALSGLASWGIQSAALGEAAVAGLGDASQEVRQYSASIVFHLAPATGAAAPRLVSLVESMDTSLDAMPLLSALMKLGPAAQVALPMLRTRVAQGDDTWGAAAAALACISHDAKEVDGAVQVLIDSLRDESQRYMGIYRLTQVGPPAARAALIMRVWMKSDTVWRLPAAAALLRMEGERAKDALEVLTQALRGNDAAGAVRVLSEISDPCEPLAGALAELANEPTFSSRYAALRMLLLMKASGPAVLRAMKTARTDPQGSIRALGAYGLAHLAADHDER